MPSCLTTLFGNTQVTSNGVVSLGEEFDSTVSSFPSDKQLVAPFWTQYNFSNTLQGQVYYRKSVVPADLAVASSLAGAAFRSTVSLSSIVVVTWEYMRGNGSFDQVCS